MHLSCKNEANCHKMIEIGDLANFYNVESGDIKENQDHLIEVLDMKHANGYSGYSEAFSQSHGFNMYNSETTVQEEETASKIAGDNTDTSVDVQRQNQLEHQEPQDMHNISAHTASQSNYLKLNEKIYTTEKRHKCDLCSYSTSRKGNLTKHTLVHTGQKPYMCDLCDYRTAHSGDLKKHKLIHSGEKLYKCDICSYSAKHKFTLQIHQRIHSGERPYKCDFCDYSAKTWEIFKCTS